MVGDRGIDIATNLSVCFEIEPTVRPYVSKLTNSVESRVLTEKIAAYVIGEGHRQGHLEWLRGLQCDMR